MNPIVKNLLPHLAALLILMAIAFVYFLPSVQGKVLSQSDNRHAYGMQAEMRKVRDDTGKLSLWTNGAFAGMPTYQILNSSTKTMLRYPYRGFTLGNSVTVPHTALFLTMICFYILMVSMKVDWRLGIIGAIAFGLCSNHVILAEAGHSTKLISLAYVPAVLAGMLLAYRGKYLLGAGMTAFFLGLQVYANHLQITYYFLIIMAIYGVMELIKAGRENNWAHFIKASGGLVLAAIIAFAANATNIWVTQEYSKETIRGKSELSSKKGQDGLDKDYAFNWSYGIGETMTLMFPNARGGGAAQSISDKEVTKYVRQQLSRTGMPQAQVNRYTENSASFLYWGEQPFTSGPIYYGAIVCFLFFLGAFMVKGSLKWWLIIASVVIIILSWGKNFFINDLMFSYFPYYNKFRSVSMILGLGQITFVLLGILGLQQFFSKTIAQTKQSKDSNLLSEPMSAADSSTFKKNALIYAGGIAGGVCLLMLLASSTLGFSGANDGEVLNGLSKFRASMLRMDVMRTLFFIAATFGILWFYLKGQLKSHLAIPAIGLLLLVDMWTVANRFVSYDKFENKAVTEAAIQPTPADEQIMQDTEKHFRVLDLSRGGLTSNSTASYFHKSLSGYHAAKLMRYQELIDAYQFDQDAANRGNILDMLNTKYIINQGANGQPVPITRPTRLGNAWFVDNFQLVDNADQELAAIDKLEPRTKAVIQKKHADYLNGLMIKNDSLSKAGNYIRLTDYHPDNMKYEYNANGEQLAVFSEIYYPPAKGWKVFIDGKEQNPAFIKANYLLRALRVPAGKHTLEMRFEPRSFYTGETISFIASLLALLGLFGGLFMWGRGLTAEALEPVHIYDPEPATKHENVKPTAKKTVQKTSKGKKRKK